MSKNKQAAIWATVAVTMLIVGVVTYARQRPKRPVSNKAPVIKTMATDKATPTDIVIQTPTSTPEAIATSTATSTRVTIPIRKRKPPVSTKLSYGDAVNKYGSLRIQFSPGCLQASPNQIAVANPVTIMLDNRSDSTQIISVAGSTYILNAYDYMIVMVNEKILPVNLFINCNGQKNVAQLILQK